MVRGQRAPISAKVPTTYAKKPPEITVPTPWAGHYVLEVAYVDEKSGEIDGVKFDRTRHVSTLSFVQPDGVPWSASR